ncbi:MAG: universal stress protein [Acidimicrobiia bacterium]|jgi:nucleotide-binding universal stress UspA family protein
MSVHTMVVAHDRSDGAAHALAWAVELARQTGARLVVVHAWSALDDLGKHPDHADLAQLHDEALAELRDEWCRDAFAAGVEVDVRIVEDRPVPGIVQAARDAGADLVVCGTRGRGRVTELVLGSVARELPEQSHLPVVIVPPR